MWDFLSGCAPGMQWTLMPRCCRYRASSPPRPNTYGSPPFNRTTCRPHTLSMLKSNSMTQHNGTLVPAGRCAGQVP